MKQKHFWLVCTLVLVVCAGLASCGGGDDEELTPKTPDSETPGGGETPSYPPHDYVDLGLADGTLWATMNVGASSPEDYGDYFAWGETKPKGQYDWSTYTWCDGDYKKLTKYNYDSKYGKVDEPTPLYELLPEDDAAYVNWGPEWRMPSLDQIEKLIDGCNWEWMQQNGVYGRKGTSKTNGNTIFLPAEGYRWDAWLEYAGECGYCWSRTLCSDSPPGAYNLGFISGEVSTYGSTRSRGQSVRPVRAK